MNVPHANPPGSEQRRTNVACRRCHLKKVKCDGKGGLPCTGCRSTNTDCVHIESQRGRYIRKRPQAQKTKRKSLSQANQPDLGVVLPPSSVSQPSSQPGLPPTPKKTFDFFQKPIERADPEADDVSSQDDGLKLYLHIADQGVSSMPQPISREKETLFLGESFSLTYVVHDVLAPFLGTEYAPHYRKRLHFPVDEALDSSLEVQRDMVKQQKRLLQDRNIWVRPDPTVVDRLLVGYFKWFHPAYPVLEKSSILCELSKNQLSLLILNAVLMIAVTVCDEADLTLLGVENRHQGRELFYRQARVLYETDSDPDKLHNVVAAFLISFWWGGPNDQKDSWHWLGIAVSSAQNLGMHRSTAESHMSSNRVKMWRRIWWSIRIRDALVSSSIGRPQHFSIYDCDVEILSLHDLEGEFQTELELHYACQMARLCSICAILVSDIITSRYSVVKPNNSTEKRMHLEEELENFRLEIPKPLKYDGIGADGDLSLWAAMLLLAHKLVPYQRDNSITLMKGICSFGVILLSRPPHTSCLEAPQPWGNHSKALAAANEVTRVIEDILSLSMGRICQIHTIPALFNSLAMHVFTICTSHAIERQLAENRARTCMLGLMSLQESWPVSGWILRLFVYIMERLKTRPNTLNPGSSSSANLHARVNPPFDMGLGGSLVTQIGVADTDTTAQVHCDGNSYNQQSHSDSGVTGSLIEDGNLLPDLFFTNEFGVGLEACNIDFFDLLRFPSETM
ncbi:unnamed protein product [Penicillium salamii]|uniref:Zn(2)-C6 fungal-type domain-containing protein n=1 Tax=Penicillium salamii TaxID=1612424 RepID=A0A9W4JQN3_9EURO|nr:unnamed protein product [Penicillium salamii]CAG8048533.1 unnamed protein product [Penicillium salamii]CAG8121335.1 unnamed protein product [Penicillium salamii]CAG8345311.1 unnamed protein product [Penicillium salamii]CAG8406808.1 unnamed protein product [Penicillium salamii]